MHLKLILNHIFILLNLFCLIFSVIITIIISIPHYKTAPFSSLTFCLHWLMRVKLCLRLFIKFRRLQRKVICSLPYMHYSSLLTYQTNLPKFAFVSKAKHLFLSLAYVWAKNQVKAALCLILASASPLSYLETPRSILMFFSLPVPQAFQLLLEYFFFPFVFILCLVSSVDILAG